MTQRELFRKEREYKICFVAYPNGRAERGVMQCYTVMAFTKSQARRKARELREQDRSGE